MDSSFNGTNFHTETLNLRSDSNHLGELRNLTLLFTGECERYPYFGMVERYYLKVDCEQGAFVFGESIWGALRGLETFSQLLVHVGVDQFVLHTARIHDYPRYSHRGLLIDTSRHFLPKKQILKTIDAMEMNKLNVLHWHMTDDQSFPFESETFPQLSRKGSYHASTHVYKAKDIGDIIEYARLRAVRIIPEFDSPGHTFSWGLGYPQLITACYDEQNQIKGGLLDPTSAVTYSFIRKLFLEIAEKFPDKYFHLGGDEVEDDCWAANINITSFMNRTNMTDDYERLQGFYVGQLVKIANHLNRSSIVWQEVLNSIGDDLPKDVLVQIWIEWPSVDLRWRDAIGNATAAGYKVLLSAPWYLDHISATVDWRRFYEEDPEDFDGTEQQRKLVIGGEACMWGEFTDASNLISKTWFVTSPHAYALCLHAMYSILGRELVPSPNDFGVRKH